MGSDWLFIERLYSRITSFFFPWATARMWMSIGNLVSSVWFETGEGWSLLRRPRCEDAPEVPGGLDEHGEDLYIVK